MRPDEIGRGYDAITHLWLEPRMQTVGIPQLERALQFVTGRRDALDVGCGCSGRFIDRLSAEGFRVEGVDVSQNMIALARQRHPEAVLHHADICRWRLPREYDVIVAWDSIWHVPLEQQEPVTLKLCEGLAPNGVWMFTMGGLDEPGEKTDACMGPPMYYSTLGIPRTLELLAQCGCVCRHLEYDQHPSPHAYVIAQKLAHRAATPTPGRSLERSPQPGKSHALTVPPQAVRWAAM
jgi:SAM-dependent methyltransferase